NNYNVSSRKPIYLYRLIIKEPVVNFDKDIYTDKIIKKLYINSTEDIVTFGESPEDAKNNCNSIIEDLKNKHYLETEIEYSDIISEIISPWN
ncbi:hypothetical protein F2Y93_12465, partial [Aphanizomenon flos-aquae CCAP 1446/1C]|nr:hypothetical protein [Anabaena sp. CCAP 1446/1C]